MLIVTGLIEIAPEGVEAAKAAAQAMVAETLKEEGCIIYEFSQVIGSETRFRVYEEWVDRPALEAHFSAPHMAVFQQALGQIGVLSNDVCCVVGGEKQPPR